MMLPPALLHVCIRGPHSRWPTLWLPLFLLWPLCLALLLLAAPFALVALLVLHAVRGLPLAQACHLLTRTYELLCATRGTRVDVSNHRTRVLIALY